MKISIIERGISRASRRATPALLCAILSLTAWRVMGLEPPATITAGAGTDTGMVAVAWSAAAGASEYLLYRDTQTEPDTAPLLATTTNLVYDDATAVPGIVYHYWVQARAGLTNSPFSAGAEGWRALMPPAEIAAGAGTLTHAVALTWTPVAYAAQYEIWRHAATNDAATAVLLTNTTATAYDDITAWPVRRHVYRVRALATNDNPGRFSAMAEGWRRPAVPHDYDLDNRADIALYNEIANTLMVYFSKTGYAPQSANVGGRGYAILSADFDADGKADPAIYHAQSGLWILLLSAQAYAPFTMNFGGAQFRPVAGDFDGDGKADPALYNEAAAAWLVRLSNTGYAEFTLTFGGRGWRAMPADYDGDGQTDPAVYNEAQGTWNVLFSAQNYTPFSAGLGGPWFRAVPADFDGDGKADPAVYHETTGEWRALMSGAQYTPISAACGGAGWRAVPADYDGDGKADPVVRQVSSGAWYGLFSGNNYAPVQAQLAGAGAVWRPVSDLSDPPFFFVAFGDSITYGYGSSTQSTNTGYPLLLERKLNETFGGYFVSINVGIDGEDTAEGVARFATVMDMYAPQLLLLMEGINDLGGSREFYKIENNLRYMISAAMARGIPVVLASISPVISNAYNDRSAQYARIIEFNPRIYAIASDYGIPVAQVFEAITSVSGWQTLLMEQESANHPNDAGYQYVINAFYNVVANELNQGRLY